jgi:S-adenosylmethionine decarboxylase
LLTLDLYDCKEGVCDDLGLCYQFLEDVVVELGMRKQSPPFIFRSDGEKYPDKAGLSGWVPLIESGIQIHTLSPKNFISIDVYSCGPFRKKRLEKFVKAYFSPRDVETNLIWRGTKYHRRPVRRAGRGAGSARR